MREIERKILGINKAEVLARIKRLKPAPKRLFQGLVRVKYFDFPDHSIHRRHDLLRVREFAEKGKPPCTEFVYKTHMGVKKGCKHFDEMETRMADPKAFNEISRFLRGLGLKQTVYYEKRRALYKWGKIKFELDEHPKIPAFLEIEGPSPAVINKAIKLLELSGHEQTVDSIGALIKRKYPKISLDGLKF